MLRTIIFKLCFYLIFILWAPIITLALVSKKLTRIIAVSMAAQILFFARIIVGLNYIVHYLETAQDDIPVIPNGNIRSDGKSIIAAKHMSVMEVIILTKTIPNFTFIVKRELMWIPIYGWVFGRLGLIPVNRSRGKTNMNKLLTTTAKKIMDGYTLIVFPEGTRTKPGSHPALKRGLLFIAHELKLPIQPVGTDTGIYWPKRGKMHPGTANVYFEPVLPSTATLEEIHGAINKHSA